MTFTVFFDHIEGWSTGFSVETDESEAALLSRLGREGVVIDRRYNAEFYPPSQIKRLQIDKKEVLPI